MGGTIFSGDVVFLTAHTAKVLDIQDAVVQARYTDHGEWQQFVIQRDGVGPIRAGELVFLKAHTGNFVDVEGVTVSARWTEQGLWQSLTIDKHSRRILNAIENEDSQFGLALGVGAGLVAAAFMLTFIVVVAGRKQRQLQFCAKLPNGANSTSDSR